MAESQAKWTQELGESELEGPDLQRSRSVRDQGDETKKVRQGGEVMKMCSSSRVPEEANNFGLRTGAAVDPTNERKSMSTREVTSRS